ncbi:hypothetical protein R3P38DRAFT_2846911 [Favolaschia claudopus]|uniref:BAG domain-containing protein n=1 Tax=Favolaschia claudopus TaxID=2862362 RepID=A0AAW0DVW8_9AGAR
MFSSFYPSPSRSYYSPAYYSQPPAGYYRPSAYEPYSQPSSYARALAQQQQQQQRARELALAQERERQRLAGSRYFPNGYDYEPESDEDDYPYLHPRQRALLEAKRRQEALEQQRRQAIEARMARELALKQQQEDRERNHPQSPIRSTVSPSATEPTPKPTASPAVPTPTPSPSPSPAAPSPERLEEAATTIQTHYRIHRALRAISSLASQFQSIKSSFVPPTSIDYQSTDGVVSIPVPQSPVSNPSVEAGDAKLAFTPKNIPLHTYNELLSRLLVSLDAVESRGDRRVREQRRAIVREVEAEAARFEAWWQGVWKEAQARKEESEEMAEDAPQEEEKEVCAMVVDADEEEPALPELSPAAADSDSDVEPDLVWTPPETPAASPELVLSPESELEREEGVLVGAAEEPASEKNPITVADDFVLV